LFHGISCHVNMPIHREISWESRFPLFPEVAAFDMIGGSQMVAESLRLAAGQAEQSGLSMRSNPRPRASRFGTRN
jgi:hypothetical protein